MESGGYMNKRVYNKTFGKIVRTLGFVLVLVSSLYIATSLIIENDTLPFINILTPFAQTADGFLSSVPIFSQYAGIALVLGLILILWAIRKGLILRILLTIILLFGFIESSISGTSALVPVTLSSPSFLTGILDMLETFVNQITAMSPYVIPGVGVAAPFLLWILFAYKKPGRFSIFMLRMGSIALFLAILMLAVAELFATNLLDIEIYMTINMVLYIVTYLFFIVGGLFGTIGVTRK